MSQQEKIKVKNKPRRRPTVKQKKAIDNLVGNGGNVTQAMIDAGYSPATANTPQKLTESEAYKEAFGSFTPNYIEEKQKELLELKRFEYFTFPKNMSDEEIEEKVNDIGIKVINISQGEKGKYAFYTVIDAQARKAALDMVHKIQGNYAPEKSINLNVEVEGNEEVKKLTEQLNALHRGTGVRSDGGPSGAVDPEVQNKE